MLTLLFLGRIDRRSYWFRCGGLFAANLRVQRNSGSDSHTCRVVGTGCRCKGGKVREKDIANLEEVLVHGGGRKGGCGRSSLAREFMKGSEV